MTGKIKKIISTENGETFVADIEDIENKISQNSSNLETAKQELSNKYNEALSEAKAYTDQEKAKYLPLTGTADNASNLGGYPSTNFVRSINNISPDENGNVKVTTSGADLTGLVKSVNNVQPDSNGNVKLGTEKSTFNKVVYDTGYFSIGTDKTYNFDLTGTDLENVSKENVNVRLVVKVVTAHNGFEVGDIAQLNPTIDHGYNVLLNVCTYIRGNTLYVYSSKDEYLSIISNNWMLKDKVQIKAVLTAFVPDDGSILLIAEDQTNTSKLIGLPDGTLTWKDKNLVRSVNGVNADENGNVKVTTSGADLTGLVKSVNNVQPDSNGNITIEAGKVKTVNNVQPDSTGNVQLGFEFSTEDDINGLF